MAISRMQMKRQLRAGGGIMNITPREKYGLGSSLKKFVRKVIPNEVSEVAVKAAPFVAPFNPLLAGAMAGIGGFDQTGSIGKSLKSGLLTYGGGQAARYLGGAGFQRGYNPFQGFDASASFGGLGSLFSSPIGTESGLRLGQYKMFGGPGREEFLKSQEVGKAIQTDAARTARLQDLDTFDSIEAFEAAQKNPKLAQIKLDADKVIENIYGQGQKTDYGNLFRKVVEPGATLGERTQAITDLGGKAIKDLYTNDKGQVDKLMVAATIAGGASYLEAKKLAEEAELVDDADEYTEEMYNADKQRYTDYYSKILPASSFGINAAEGGIINTDRANFKDGLSKNRVAQLLDLLEGTTDPSDRKMIQDEIDMLTKKFATGGRVGFKDGTRDKPSDRIKIMQIDPLQAQLDEELGIGAALAPGLMKLMMRGAPKFTSKEKTMVIRNLAGRQKDKPGYKELGIDIPSAKKIMDNPADNLKDATILKEFVKMIMGKKDGGIIDTREAYAMGSEVPVRQNEAGVNEMDFRETGGFVPPIGVKEKADDIPAMLSNNEFVFTADAVRAAGGGSVNKGAQKMYALMKQLEGKMA